MKTAIKLANTEMERIEKLKDKVKKSQEEIEKAKKNEIDKLTQIEQLKREVADQRRLMTEPCDLEETRILRDLQNEYDDVLKDQEDQTETLQSIMFKNGELNTQKMNRENEVKKIEDEIFSYKDQIMKSKI